jgi:hypothetical protein
VIPHLDRNPLIAVVTTTTLLGRGQVLRDLSTDGCRVFPLRVDTRVWTPQLISYRTVSNLDRESLT